MKTIRKGDTGPDVVWCQELLTQNGFSTTADGIFGSTTHNRIMQFQTQEDISPDGIVGPTTWAHLEGGAPNPNSEPISFLSLVSLFPQMLPQTYVLKGAQCPSNPPGVSLKADRIGMERTNCVQFTAWLLGNAFFGVSFTSRQWKLWMVSGDYQGNPPVVPNWGPRVVMEWGVGTTSPGFSPMLVQSFTQTGGHSWIVVDYCPESSKILTLEANGTIDGAGWNQIGPLRECENPGLNWKDQVSQTWKSRVETNVAVHIARLAIDPQSVQDWLGSKK